jgi:hypothetical protein
MTDLKAGDEVTALSDMTIPERLRRADQLTDVGTRCVIIRLALDHPGLLEQIMATIPAAEGGTGQPGEGS